MKLQDIITYDILDWNRIVYMKKNEYVIQSWELLASLGRIDEGASAKGLTPKSMCLNGPGFG